MNTIANNVLTVTKLAKFMAMMFFFSRKRTHIWVQHHCYYYLIFFWRKKKKLQPSLFHTFFACEHAVDPKSNEMNRLFLAEIRSGPFERYHTRTECRPTFVNLLRPTWNLTQLVNTRAVELLQAHV